MLLSIALRQQNMFIPALRVFCSPHTSWCIWAIISLGIICRQEVHSVLLWFWLAAREWVALEPRWCILFPDSWTVWVTKALLAGLCTYAGLEFGLTRPFWHWQGAQPLHYGLFTLPQGGMGKFLLQITTIFCKILFRGETSLYLTKNTDGFMSLGHCY